eukprot:232700_1
MASKHKLTPSSAWLMMYQDNPKINWYACCIENMKSMQLKLKVTSYGIGGLPELTNFLSTKSMKTEAIFAQLLVNESTNKRQYKLINIQWIGTQLRFITKAKITSQLDSIMNEFPVRHLEIKLNETKLHLISSQNLEKKLNAYRGPYKVKYNFIVECVRYGRNINEKQVDNKLQLDYLIKDNEKLQSKVNELEIKLFQKQQEIDLLIQNQQKMQFSNKYNHELKDDGKDFCAVSFHLWMDKHIKVDEIKKLFVQNAKYNDIRMMIYLDKDILLNEIGINSKIFIKIILNECEQLIESQTEFTKLINNRKYVGLFNNKGILTLEHFERFIRTQNDLKNVIEIQNSKHRQQIWNKLTNVINNDVDDSEEGHNTDYY